MIENSLAHLQKVVRNKTIVNLNDYALACRDFLIFLQTTSPTRIVARPTRNSHYIFYQYGNSYEHRITRSLNTRLFMEMPSEFERAFERFMTFLADLKQHQETVLERKGAREYIESNELNKVVYTMQQSLGCVGDSFENSNQARKIMGQLFESMVKLIIQDVGVVCEPRTIKVPIPGYPDQMMSFELDVVFSRNKVIITAETKDQYIHASEIVGSVKTTSKDRIDKIFLDKYFLTRLLQRDIPVVAIFLHDVQRAAYTQRLDTSGDNLFGIASTFKTNHFLAYTVAFNKLNGVYYVDPRPEMVSKDKLREQIRNFQQFLVKDLWVFSK